MAVVIAQEEARVLCHDHVGSDHLLLALLSQQQEGEIAGRVLASAGITRDAVLALMPDPDSGWPLSGHIPFGDDLKRAMKCALMEAQKLGHSHIGTGHLLLGMMAEPGYAARAGA
jgi:ATP-dependent Clp protease ATP-binding subunit ClpC